MSLFVNDSRFVSKTYLVTKCQSPSLNFSLGDLLDGQWHSVTLEVSADRSALTLTVDGAAVSSSPADADVLRNLGRSIRIFTCTKS